MKKFIYILFALIITIVPALAVENLDFKSMFISDNAKVITESDYEQINNIIDELQKKTTAEHPCRDNQLKMQRSK